MKAVLLAGLLAGAAVACAGTAPAPVPARPAAPAAALPDAPAAFVDELERRAPARPARVLVTLRGQGAALQAAKARLRAAFAAAGVPRIDDIEGTAVLVVEALPEQLRQAATGPDVLRLQLDAVAPPG